AGAVFAVSHVDDRSFARCSSASQGLNAPAIQEFSAGTGSAACTSVCSLLAGSESTGSETGGAGASSTVGAAATSTDAGGAGASVTGAGLSKIALIAFDQSSGPRVVVSAASGCWAFASSTASSSVIARLFFSTEGAHSLYAFSAPIPANAA